MGGGNVPVPMVANYPRYAPGPVGQKIEHIYRDRLGQFDTDGPYRKQMLNSRLYYSTNDDEDHVKLFVYSPPNLSRPLFKDAITQKFKPTKRGEAFGPSWSTHWFKIYLTVPTNMRKGKHLEFEWDALNEGLIYTEDGEAQQGLTGNGERTQWPLPKAWQDGKEHIFYIEMACNRMFGNAPDGDNYQPPLVNLYFPLNTARILDVNLEARQLHIDFWQIGDAAREFPSDSWERHKALMIENQIIDTFTAGNGTQESILKCRAIAQEYIGKNINSEKVYESGTEAIVNAIGNCHIDTCWLWPWAETKRKVARSWTTQCSLMEQYPEYRFACSQAQQYKWLETIYPKIFARVKGKVKEGKFQPVGGSWVEHDTNMPSGESLVRQFLYGQRYFQSRFGERCKVFWLPDTFGYSSQLPQICRLAGMPSFFTQKLSWNNINTFPHTTFNWVALDGSQVLCHMPPTNTYTADAHWGDVKRSVSQHKSLDQDNTSLLAYGKGDGGGGPTPEMLEKLRRCRGMSDTTSTLLPRVKVGGSVDEFYASLHKKAETGTKFATWYGELYLEFHRGTYTTQSNNKRNNRRQEIMMHDIEYLATLASMKSKTYKVPKAEIDELWENILLCQFHDCLPGSSIGMCYRDSDALYAHNAKLGASLKEKALSALSFTTHVDPSKPMTALNTLPWERAELVKIPDAKQTTASPSYQLLMGGQGVVTAAPSTLIEKYARIEEKGNGIFVLSNKHFRVTVESGAITSLIDLRVDREVIAKGGRANQLVIFDDKPLSFQAWDVEVYHLQSRKELPAGTSEIIESGPYRVGVMTKTKISEVSWINTVISLDASVDDNFPSFVTVDSEVEWHETWRFLKVEFPVDVVNTEASYETQYGVIRRPTHYNTSWDMAKFEVCCHKFADLSEANYGVSILNESKYGFATAGNVMRLSLVRAPKGPDDQADMGHHHIRWAIMPHVGALGPQTVHAAHNFNHPMSLISQLDSKPDPEKNIFNSITLSGGSSLVLDCIKRGEDDEDVSRGEFTTRPGQSIILRIYESLGGKTRGVIHTTLPVKKVFQTNALEDDQEECAISDEGDIKIQLRAFEVATYRLQL